MRIGLLEDDAAIQEMLLLVLQDEGYSVVNYPDADACLAAFQQFETGAGVVDATSAPVDLLIVDWRLNGPMTGIEVIDELRKHPRFATLPIILTTAATFNDTGDLQHLHVALLEKPFSVDDMAALVQSLISARG